jgi:hypothetical protein
MALRAIVKRIHATTDKVVVDIVASLHIAAVYVGQNNLR